MIRSIIKHTNQNFNLVFKYIMFWIDNYILVKLLSCKYLIWVINACEISWPWPTFNNEFIPNWTTCFVCEEYINLSKGLTEKILDIYVIQFFNIMMSLHEKMKEISYVINRIVCNLNYIKYVLCFVALLNDKIQSNFNILYSVEYSYLQIISN